MGRSEYTKKEGYRESSHLRMQSDCKKEKGRVTEETRNGREVHSGAEEKACVCRAEGGQECRHGGEEAEAAFKQQRAVAVGMIGFNGVKLAKARFNGVGECHGHAPVIDNKQLVTHEARYVLLLSGIKVRKMKDIFILRRLDNFFRGINNTLLIQPLLP